MFITFVILCVGYGASNLILCIHGSKIIGISKKYIVPQCVPIEWMCGYLHLVCAVLYFVTDMFLELWVGLTSNHTFKNFLHKGCSSVHILLKIILNSMILPHVVAMCRARTNNLGIVDWTNAHCLDTHHIEVVKVSTWTLSTLWHPLKELIKRGLRARPLNLHLRMHFYIRNADADARK